MTNEQFDALLHAVAMMVELEQSGSRDEYNVQTGRTAHAIATARKALVTENGDSHDKARDL